MTRQPRQAQPDVAIVGGGYAGLMAAGRLVIGGRRVVLIDPKPRFVDRLELHRRLAGRGPATRPWSRVLPRGVERLEGRAIAWQGGALTVQTAHGLKELFPARVLLAAGSRSKQPWRSPLVIDLEDLGAAKAIAFRNRVVVVGGGATGVETAAALARSGRQVTLVAKEFPGMSEAASGLIRSALSRRGVTLIEDKVREVGDGAAHREHGSPIPCDAVVPCLGFTASPLAQAWDLPTDPQGRVVASASLKVAPNTYAAGDALTLPSQPWLSSGCLTAMPLGGHAAASLLADLAGEPPPPFRYGWVAKTLDLSGRHAVLQRLKPDGSPARAVAGVGPALFKSALLAIAPRLARWEAAAGRALYTWNPGPTA